jgi:hypothetical protein
MTENLRIERVRRVPLAARLSEFVDVDPLVLFNSFYTLFGFLITGSLLAAAFISFKTHQDYSSMLFWFAPASSALWGIGYAAWNDKLRWAWNTLTASTTIGMLAGIFLVLFIPAQSRPDLLLQLIICALALPALWAVIMGLRQINW